ncbi:MAG: ketoacyl-ACP synthase III [Kordiimonadaceae bacterium]|jgi:3-oxoacyl-[acyl-carrier-protein] synthase-3|nr:ketoacyl-ACP synthase III [Kordiimonadaceae bacterium]MDB4044530.1 ketoacyl-ACP synthase III [Emcibacteraceae bacterium]MBT6134885.1 ketoacyl-ACP synthase III [Kordiimonadaceae bacterium]MBT6466441.1 ketoacyl-ACP synthase III [Kordiimonadaceae bacterium]MBT7544361.1 ketoacyl-ACP synthase III [Kordiimonadaceae bacterium]
MSVIRSVITGTGSYLPKQILTNSDLEKKVDTTDEWIIERTGIKQRHIAAEDEVTSDLAVIAAKRALESASLDPNQIDLIILATSTADQTFPSTATTIQRKLGITGGAAFDIQAVCSGFVYALTTADNFIKAGQAKHVLVIGAEIFSRILDWEDRTTCVLFGDGAGAVVLSSQNGVGNNTDQGLLSSRIHSDGRYNELLFVDGGVSSTGTVGQLRMKGREVFRHAIVNLASVVGEVLEDSNMSSENIDWIVPHQANKRILDGTARKLKVATNKVIVTVEKHANTSAASIPLALDEAVKDGRITRGQVVILEAMGGGFTWGACLLRW